jgi:death on curing protein
LPTNKSHYRLTREDALEAHDKALTHGGRRGIISMDSIESALGRPYTGYYRPIYLKVAALVQSMAGNHGFVDGNKRTTLILLNTLILRSGYELRGTSLDDLNDAVEALIIEAADGRYDFDRAAQWFKLHLHRRIEH